MSLPDHGRVLFSATLVRGHIAKFHIPYLRWFKEQGWETWVAARNDYPDGVCEIPYCDHFVNIDFSRSPFSKQTLVAYRQLRNLLACERFNIVHTHTPVGSVLMPGRQGRKSSTPRTASTSIRVHQLKTGCCGIQLNASCLDSLMCSLLSTMRTMSGRGSSHIAA